MIVGFSLAMSVLVMFFAPHLIQLFVNSGESEVIAIGARDTCGSKGPSTGESDFYSCSTVISGRWSCL